MFGVGRATHDPDWPSRVQFSESFDGRQLAPGRPRSSSLYGIIDMNHRSFFRNALKTSLQQNLDSVTL